MKTSETKVKKPKLAKPAVAKTPTTASGGVPKKAVKATKAKTSPKREKSASDKDKVVLRIRVRAYESKIIDASVKQIMDTATRHDAVIIGPVPLPTEIKKYTVNRSAFIYKNSREQFEIRVHKRLIDIINPSPKTIEALTNLSLPSGVDIDVKMM